MGVFIPLLCELEMVMTVSAAHGDGVTLGDAQDSLSPVLCHLNSVETSLRPTTPETLIMRSNGMS